MLTEILNQDLAACGIRGYPTFDIGDTLHFVLRYPFLLKISVPGQAGCWYFVVEAAGVEFETPVNEQGLFSANVVAAGTLRGRVALYC